MTTDDPDIAGPRTLRLHTRQHGAPHRLARPGRHRRRGPRCRCSSHALRRPRRRGARRSRRARWKHWRRRHRAGPGAPLSDDPTPPCATAAAQSLSELKLAGIGAPNCCRMSPHATPSCAPRCCAALRELRVPGSLRPALRALRGRRCAGAARSGGRAGLPEAQPAPCAALMRVGAARPRAEVRRAAAGRARLRQRATRCWPRCWRPWPIRPGRCARRPPRTLGKLALQPAAAGT